MYNFHDYYIAMYVYIFLIIMYVVLLCIGQKYNKDGNRIKWWTDPSIKNFDNLTKCFVNQYNGYSLQGFKVAVHTVTS